MSIFKLATIFVLVGIMVYGGAMGLVEGSEHRYQRSVIWVGVAVLSFCVLLEVQ